MTPLAIISELEKCGAKVVTAGERIRLIHAPGNPPPPALVEAARAHKAALRAMIEPSQVAPASLPAHVADGLNRLAAATPMLDDWPRRIEAAREMAAAWDARARQLGWSDTDLYGLHPGAPGTRREARGLAWCLDHGSRVTAITANCAVIANQLRYYRAQHPTDAVVAWDLLARGRR